MQSTLVSRTWTLFVGLVFSTAVAAHDGHGQDGIPHLHGTDLVRDTLILASIVLVAALAWRRK